MTELQKLRQENEMLRNKLNRQAESTSWREVKDSYQPYLEGVYSIRDSARVENAINTVIRYRFGLKRVFHLQEKDVELAKGIAFEILKLLNIEMEEV